MSLYQRRLSVLYTTNEWPAKYQIPEDGILTAERLRQQLSYCAETGIFTRRVNMAANARAGDVVVGHDNGRGYLYTGLDGKSHYLHRLAWLHVYGVWPVDQIDHINTIKKDNRIRNLREASNSENHQNRPPRLNTKSGIKGVYVAPSGNFGATICVAGKSTFLGTFANIEDAKAARKAAEKKYHGAFAYTAANDNHDQPAALAA